LPTFVPPIIYDIPPILPDTRGIQRALYKFQQNLPRYVRVYLLSNNVFVQDTATDENSNTDIPQPYNINEPSGLISSVEFYNYDTMQPQVIDSYLPVWIVLTFACAPQTVSVGLAAMLTAAGYGSLIT
jgi:hypothetical protein